MALPARHRRELLIVRRHVPALWLLAGLTLGLSAGSALASDTFLERERPTRTRSTVAVYPNEVVLEAGALIDREGPTERLALGELAVRVGVYESVELRLELGSWERVERAGVRETGVSDSELSVKVEIRDYSSGWIPESAIAAGLRLPSGEAAVGGDRDGGFALLALSWELGPGLSITGNAGFARRDSERGRFTQGVAGTALAWRPRELTTFYAEVYAVSEDEESTGSSLRLGLGASHLLGESCALDLRIERGSSGADPDYLVGAGVSFRF